MEEYIVTQDQIYQYQDRSSIGAYLFGATFGCLVVVFMIHTYFKYRDIETFRVSFDYPFVLIVYVGITLLAALLCLKSIYNFIYHTDVELDMEGLTGKVEKLNYTVYRGNRKEYHCTVCAVEGYTYNVESKKFELSCENTRKYKNDKFYFIITKDIYDSLSLNSNVFSIYSKKTRGNYDVRAIDPILPVLSELSEEQDCEEVEKIVKLRKSEQVLPDRYYEILKEYSNKKNICILYGNLIYAKCKGDIYANNSNWKFRIKISRIVSTTNRSKIDLSRATEHGQVIDRLYSKKNYYRVIKYVSFINYYDSHWLYSIGDEVIIVTNKKMNKLIHIESVVNN